VIVLPVLRREPRRFEAKETALAAAAPPLPGGKAGPAAAGRSSRSGGRPDMRLCACQAGILKQPGNGHALPAVQPCAADAPSALPAVRPTNAAKAALPGRCCGPVRVAAWPHLITTHTARRSVAVSPGTWTFRGVTRQGSPQLKRK